MNCMRGRENEQITVRWRDLVSDGVIDFVIDWTEERLDDYKDG